MQYAKNLLFPLLLLFWLFCLPLAFAIYSPVLYQSNCHWNERCVQLGEQGVEQRTGELNRFFLHRLDVLPSPWTNKENRHLQEVRTIYDGVFLLFALISVVFVLDWLISKDPRRNYTNYSRNALFISVGLLLAVVLIAPFFNSFWIKVFHPLLFDNELWRTDPRDISWYLMPKAFFLRVIVFICGVTLLLNAVLWGVLKRRY